MKLLHLKFKTVQFRIETGPFRSSCLDSTGGAWDNVIQIGRCLEREKPYLRAYQIQLFGLYISLWYKVKSALTHELFGDKSVYQLSPLQINHLNRLVEIWCSIGLRYPDWPKERVTTFRVCADQVRQWFGVKDAAGKKINKVYIFEKEKQDGQAIK